MSTGHMDCTSAMDHLPDEQVENRKILGFFFGHMLNYREDTNSQSTPTNHCSTVIWVFEFPKVKHTALDISIETFTGLAVVPCPVWDLHLFDHAKYFILLSTEPTLQNNRNIFPFSQENFIFSILKVTSFSLDLADGKLWSTCNADFWVINSLSRLPLLITSSLNPTLYPSKCLLHSLILRRLCHRSVLNIFLLYATNIDFSTFFPRLPVQYFFFSPWTSNGNHRSKFCFM